ncbi:MAG: DUF488 family protein [Gaiellaceae bacterium]
MSATNYTIGHGRRPVEELVECLRAAGIRTLVDVRRFPGSRRNPQFNQGPLAESLERAGIAYRHAVDLGGRRSGEPSEERFACIGQFASYVARMAADEWQRALEDAVSEPAPALMCAETAWQRCHRRWISELLTARGQQVVHLIRPHELEPHRLHQDSEVRDARLYVCGNLVA